MNINVSNNNINNNNFSVQTIQYTQVKKTNNKIFVDNEIN